MPFSKVAKDKFTSLYRQCIGMPDDDSRLVALKDDLLKLLKDNHEATEKHIHPMSMVPHIKNRGGSKMQWNKIWQKGVKILNVGASLAACGPDRAIAFVEDGDKPSGTAHIELCNTNKHYASYDDIGAIEAASVGCGHWNQMLANIVRGTPVPVEYQSNKKISEEGRPFLDKDRLCRSSKPLSQLTSMGLLTTLIRPRIAKEFPELPNILQKALNVENHIGEGETWDEQLMSAAQEIRNSDGKPDYLAIIKRILASEPPHALDLESQVKWCKTWGGGADQHCTTDVCDYIKLKSKNLRLSASFFDACSSLKLPPSKLPALFIAACAKTTATRGFGKDGMGTQLGSKEVKKIPTEEMIDQCMQANAYIKKAKDMVAKIKGLDEAVGKTLVGDLECNLVECVFQTFAGDKDKARTMDEWVSCFVQTLGGIAPANDDDDNAVEPESEEVTMFDATSADHTKETLGMSGFTKGAILIHKHAKAKPTELERQLEISHVRNDGSIGVFPILRNGSVGKEVSVITMDQLVEYQTIGQINALSYYLWPRCSRRSSL